MLGISCSRCFNSLLFNKWSMPTRQHAWYFMFTMLQFASVYQVEYAYTTTCLVFHVHNASIRFCLTSGVCLHTTTCLVFHVHDASIRFYLTSGVCLHDNMLGIACSRCFNSLLFNKWSMPTRQHAWYFMFTMLEFASVWQVEYAYTTTCLVFHVHDASICFCLTSGVCLHDNMLVFHVHDASICFCLTCGVFLDDNMLGISCSRCFNLLLFDKWSMPTRTPCLVFHVHDASIRFCLTSGVCLHDNMPWYFMFTMLQFASI